MKKRDGSPTGIDGPDAAPRAGISRRREPIAADRAIARHLRSLSRRPGDAKILSRMPDAVVSFDREWRYVFMNRQAELNHNSTAAEFLGHVVWEKFPEGKELESYQRYLTAMERQEEAVYEEYVPMIGRWFEQRLFPTPDGLTVIARDITDWREVRRERSELVSALAQLHAERPDEDRALPDVQGAAPLRTFTTFVPRAGARAVLLRRMRESAAVFAAVGDGRALSVEVQASSDPDGPIVITALWRSADDYARWQLHPQRTAVLADLAELIEEIRIERYEVVRRATRTDRG
jgi:PAS domain S-box-containing protein